MKTIISLTIASLSMFGVIFPLPSLQAQGTAFTYQGQLNNGSGPANGLYDFRFRLDADPEGNTILATDLTNTIPVTNGLFTTTIDFGASWFNGNNYWLEIDVRTNSPGNTIGYIPLSPLQPFTPTPYAIMANSASNLLGSVLVSQLTGTVPLAQLPGVLVTNNETGVSFSNVTLNGSFTLPAPTTIYSGGSQLLKSDANDNFFAGINAGISFTLTGMRNTGVGNAALFRDASGGYNTAIGFLTLQNNSTGNYNTAVGDYALDEDNADDNLASGYQALSNSTNGYANVAEGFQALGNSINGYGNVAEGYAAMQNSANDSQEVAIGYEALQNDNATNFGGFGNNTAVGYQALQQNTSGYYNTSVGYQSLQQNTNGEYNTAIGAAALGANTTGYFNVAEGGNSLAVNTSGAGNTANGLATMRYNTIGSYNTGDGVNALFANTNGSYNAASGALALRFNSSGAYNTADGADALYLNLTGNNNIALGYEAGYNITNSNNIDIGNSGSAADTGVIRIGSSGTQTSTYITGNVALGGANPTQTLNLDGGINVDQSGLNIGSIANGLTFGQASGEGIGSTRVGGNTDSYGLNFYTDFTKRMTILQNGNVGIGTTNPSTLLVVGTAVSPAYCNGSAWVNGSDRNSKEKFSPIDPLAVLEKVTSLPITQWKYKVESDGTEHLGPMAQDFHAAFNLNGADDKHIATVDEEGVALAAIQGLNQKLEDQTKEKDAEIQSLKQQNDSLAQRLNELAATVNQLVANHPKNN
jgi:hypothetical protein